MRRSRFRTADVSDQLPRDGDAGRNVAVAGTGSQLLRHIARLPVRHVRTDSRRVQLQALVYRILPPATHSTNKGVN